MSFINVIVFDTAPNMCVPHSSSGVMTSKLNSPITNNAIHSPATSNTKLLNLCTAYCTPKTAGHKLHHHIQKD